MSKKILISLTNPVSPERDAEFNEWFNNVHGKEVTSLPGFRSMTRYRAVAQIVPPSGAPSHRYLALYELDDPDAAQHALASAEFDMTDAIDLGGASGTIFEQFFSTKDEA